MSNKSRALIKKKENLTTNFKQEWQIYLYNNKGKICIS